MTQAHQNTTAQRNAAPSPRAALPKPSYRNLFLAPDLPDAPSVDDDLPVTAGRLTGAPWRAHGAS